MKDRLMLRLQWLFVCILLGVSHGLLAADTVVDINAKQSPELKNQQKIAAFKQLLADPNIQHWLQQSLADNELQSSEQSSEQSLSPVAVRDSFSEVIAQIRKRKETLLSAWHIGLQAPSFINQKWQQQMSGTQSLRATIFILIFLFVGAGIEWLYVQYSGPHLLHLELTKPLSLIHKLRLAGQRLLLIGVSLLFFAVGSIGTFLLFDWPLLIEYIVLEILVLILIVRTAMTTSRFILAPSLAELRLVSLNDQQAGALHFWFCMIVFLSALSQTNINALDELFRRVSGDNLQQSVLSVSLIQYLLLMSVVQLAVYRMYHIFKQASDASRWRRQCQFWSLYCAVLMLVVYVLWMIGTPHVLQSLLIIALISPCILLFKAWVNDWFDQAQNRYINSRLANQAIATATAEESQGSALDEAETVNIDPPYENYRPISARLVRFVIVLIALVALSSTWGYNILSLSQASSVSEQVFSVFIDVIVAILIADLVWVWAKTYIDKRLSDYRPPENGHAPGPEARMATLLPLLRTMLIVTLLSMVVFSVLASLGFNIGPLLAGAGVIGLAIGFGAQTLVKDVVSGIFYLIDDAFRVGEYIEIGDLRGTVESMSVRSLRVRHHRGAVHTIPFGELKAITNHSRDWVIMKLEFRIPFDTNMKQVKKLVKKIGAKLLENADFGDSFIEPLKSQGVRRMEEFNMVLGVKFMTRPGEQWVIRREAYHQIRDTFEANGIHLAERNVKVEVLNAQSLSEQAKSAAIGAAQNVMEPKGPKAPIPDEP